MIKLVRISLSTVLSAVLLSSAAYAGTVNINTASVKALAHHLSGIGTKKAQAIVDYRKEHGAFQSIEDIVEVKGIGKKLLKKNRDNLLLVENGKKASNKTKKRPLVIGAKPELKKLRKTNKIRKKKIMVEKTAEAKVP